MCLSCFVGVNRGVRRLLRAIVMDPSPAPRWVNTPDAHYQAPLPVQPRCWLAKACRRGEGRSALQIVFAEQARIHQPNRRCLKTCIGRRFQAANLQKELLFREGDCLRPRCCGPARLTRLNQTFARLSANAAPFGRFVDVPAMRHTRGANQFGVRHFSKARSSAIRN
jgi:hypothetical protein